MVTSRIRRTVRLCMEKAPCHAPRGRRPERADASITDQKVCNSRIIDCRVAVKPFLQIMVPDSRLLWRKCQLWQIQGSNNERARAKRESCNLPGSYRSIFPCCGGERSPNKSSE